MLKEEAQQCFLYCALYPSGHKIEKKELVEYWFWEGLLGPKESHAQIEDITKAKEILDELKGAYLLEIVNQEDGKEYVKMSNIVRHMAVDLTKISPQFLIKAGENLQFFRLQEDGPEVKRASLMWNQITALAAEPKFPELSTLLLQHNPIDFYLHEHFFRAMPNIKVLDLSHTDIPSLPKSTFSNLTKMRALLLRNCRNLKSLPSLANSKKLLVLDLSDTPISQLPDGMEELTNLIRLNLSHTNVGELEAELVCVLSHLEELLMITNDSGSLWGSTKGGSVKELAALWRLDILHINFLDAEVFNEYVASRKHRLSKFKFCVGGSCKEELPENSIVFINSNFLVEGKETVSLPEDTSEMHIRSNNDISWLQVTCHLKSLKVIKISGCENLVYLFKIDMLFNLPNLERILVEKCQKMEGLIESKEYTDDLLQLLVALRLKHLKVIQIFDCENLVYLFRIEMLQCFPNLQEISIRRLQKMDVEKNPNVSHPRLQELVLVDPVELKNIYEGEMKGNSQQTIWEFPKLKMQIITSLPAEEVLLRPSGINQMTKRHSFGSLAEVEGSPSRASTDEKKGNLLHSSQLSPPHTSKSVPQKVAFKKPASSIAQSNLANGTTSREGETFIASPSFLSKDSLLKWDQEENVTDTQAQQ